MLAAHADANYLGTSSRCPIGTVPRNIAATPACTCTKYDACNIGQVRTSRSCEDTNHVCCANSTIDAGGWADATRANSGREAGYGEFPWMAVILKETSREAWTRSQYVSGAAIITKDAVLTAAHKVHGLDINLQLKVRAGELSRTEQEPHPFQERLVRAIIIHEQYGENDKVLQRTH
ncbi:acrosin-like [Choristoneura fumiferana]|uniref:acrosin-like n=1 Tax=Choristoneura fumiferana TaxID=7141 RepID=UPI003D158C78